VEKADENKKTILVEKTIKNNIILFLAVNKKITKNNEIIKYYF
jgi:hypothetical protein